MTSEEIVSTLPKDEEEDHDSIFGNETPKHNNNISVNGNHLTKVIF